MKNGFLDNVVFKHSVVSPLQENVFDLKPSNSSSEEKYPARGKPQRPGAVIVTSTAMTTVTTPLQVRALVTNVAVLLNNEPFDIGSHFPTHVSANPLV